METFLWLDDIRNPFIPTYINQYPQLREVEHSNKADYSVKIVWVRNYEEFKEYLAHNPLPTWVSFDHDLADEHYTPPEYWKDYQASKEYQEKQDYTEKTGLDCAKLLVEYVMYLNTKLPWFFVHSANPVGADNIREYLINFKKFKNV